MKKNTDDYLRSWGIDYSEDDLIHYGILGMHWGIRRFQNPDGSLTPEGRERYGVKTAAETEKLSYSREYMALKQKQNRTEKENEKLKKLESGKKHFEKSAFDPDYWTKMKDDVSYEELENNVRAYETYLDSTNYGKGMKKVQALYAVPLTALGAGLDAGAAFVQINAGLPFFVTGLGTVYGYGIGTNYGASTYGEKHLEELKKELKNNKEKFVDNKTNRKNDPKTELNNYRTKVDRMRNENKKYQWSTSVNAAASKASREIKEDKAYGMVFSNPQYYLNNKGQWTYEGKTYSNVDSLINQLMKDL